MNNQQAAQYALIAHYAEARFDGNSGALPFDLAGWELIGDMTASNALFGTQALGLGNRVYFGFVARSIADPLQYIAVIRGTELPVEWLENAQLLLVPGPLKGWVEHGFWSIFKTLQLSGLTVNTFVPTLVPKGATITVIGHSLGAAIATYLMEGLARAAGNQYTVKGALFASPRPGDGHYVAAVDTLVGSTNYGAWAYLRDLVPHLPPALPFGLGFQSLPNTSWFSPAIAEVKIQNTPECNHSALSYAGALDRTTVTPPNTCIIP